MTDWSRTSGRPDHKSALAELQRTLADRKAAVASGTVPQGYKERIRALEIAIECLEFLDLITYFETNGTPTSHDFQP